MTRWYVIAKRAEKVDGSSQRLVLDVSQTQDGPTREAVVSGSTYDQKQVGDTVWLNIEADGRHEP